MALKVDTLSRVDYHTILEIVKADSGSSPRGKKGIVARIYSIAYFIFYPIICFYSAVRSLAGKISSHFKNSVLPKKVQGMVSRFSQTKPGLKASPARSVFRREPSSLTRSKVSAKTKRPFSCKICKRESLLL